MEASALLWDANIHTLLEAQIKGGIPQPLLNGPFVQTEACKRVRIQAEQEGLGRGRSTMILVTQRSPQKMMFKEAPGGGCTPAPCLDMQMGNCRFCGELEVEEGKDASGRV